uniref:Uncharacterized protein n=1 Tax=Solanum lycopersicum TaxID=4081 RepID=A0A3Q7G011_SOLLC
MADAFVSFAVKKLGDFLIQEINLLTSLREDIQWLRNELLFMQSFLKDAELKQSGDQRIQQWVFEINSIANEAVAILETYSFEAGKRVNRLKACACICRKEKKLYNVTKEIQSLKKQIMDIARKRETYGITNINSNAGEGPNNQSAMVRTLRRTTSYVDDQDYIFVGFQDVVQTLLAQLLRPEPRRSVVSIYGMGGLGKTTLARNLYTSPNIVSSFPKRAWICVSQEYNTTDLLKTIIKSIQGRTKGTLELLGTMTEGDLEFHLRDLLKECKYLVVVDDVWQREAWESLKRAFPDGKNGSRVIITTRKEDVAERADDREDQVVEADNIIRLWMAEGFIPRGERMEDVAESFLNELIRRSLVQVANTFWEKVTECRVHDLLHDLAIQKALETVHIGGIVRLDLVFASVETIYVTVWASPSVSPLHLGKRGNADELKNNHTGREVKARGTSWDVKSMDVAVAGLGWFSLGLKGEADFVMWTYDGIQITLREPLVLDRAASIERPGFWLPKAVSEAIANSSKLEGQEAREKNPSEEAMQLP